jgi:hypothetical protein
MVHLLLWSHYYISYRDYDWHDRGDEGILQRKYITEFRKFVMFFQFLGFGVGVLGVAIFAAFNFQNVLPSK